MKCEAEVIYGLGDWPMNKKSRDKDSVTTVKTVTFCFHFFLFTEFKMFA